MFRIAICDDDKAICNHVDQIIANYTHENKLSIETEVFYNGEDLCRHLNTESQFDLIFLDIEMTVMSGIDVGYEIRKKRSDYATELIYITGTSQYTRQLLDMRPLSYIEKPFADETIIEALELALRLSDELEGYFRFRIKGADYKLKFSEILYFESRLRKILLVTETKSYEFYRNLNQLITDLPKYYVQIHRSYVINIKKVTAFLGNSVLMQNDTEIMVSQTYKHRLKEIEKSELEARGLLK